MANDARTFVSSANSPTRDITSSPEPMPTSSPTQPGLLFVPDISGFTHFVAATEVEHSRHIIQELLETLIDVNEIGLTVSEIEGDAILFYRFGDAPASEQLFRQIEKMFVAFHGHLRRYETQRICRCGACVGVNSLTLKIVAHYGEISENRVKEHIKLFGKDVIAVHRLLKNGIPHHEYALFTEGLTKQWPDEAAPEWAPCDQGCEEYDVGRIDFEYVALGPLKEKIPEPMLEDYSIPGVSVPLFSVELDIDAPMDLVFGVASDLPLRLHWMEGDQRVDMLNDSFNRIGTQHRCVIDENSPVMVTTGYSRDENTITLTETDEKRVMCSVYTFRQDGPERTHLRVDGLHKKGFVLRIMFSLLLKKKLIRLFQESAANLKRYCEANHRRTKN